MIIEFVTILHCNIRNKFTYRTASCQENISSTATREGLLDGGAERFKYKNTSSTFL